MRTMKLQRSVRDRIIIWYLCRPSGLPQNVLGANSYSYLSLMAKDKFAKLIIRENVNGEKLSAPSPEQSSRTKKLLCVSSLKHFKRFLTTFAETLTRIYFCLLSELCNPVKTQIRENLRLQIFFIKFGLWWISKKNRKMFTSRLETLVLTNPQ